MFSMPDKMKNVDRKRPRQYETLEEEVKRTFAPETDPAVLAENKKAWLRQWKAEMLRRLREEQEEAEQMEFSSLGMILTNLDSLQVADESDDGDDDTPVPSERGASDNESDEGLEFSEEHEKLEVSKPRIEDLGSDTEEELLMSDCDGDGPEQKA